ncbi:HalOD1 output domain-containing protein [Halobellus sp. GM3]|uniref:HalOD1 output domain-containing protein n=1 Tax=Halobellus sp. GM3 TaxID=3458410 RepID=UPI00403E2B6D
MSSASERRRVQRQYQWSRTPPSVAIVESIAVFEDRYANWEEALDRPLNEYVDADALDSLLRNGDLYSVSLSVAGYHVWIDGATVNVAVDVDGGRSSERSR